MTEKKKLIDKCRVTHPNVRSFSVMVTEICRDDHPPSTAEWSYSGKDFEDREIFTKLKHDRTTMMIGSFNLLSPVYSAAMQRLKKKSGSLPAYHTDGGHTVTRTYECEVEYEEEEKPNKVS